MYDSEDRNTQNIKSGIENYLHYPGYVCYLICGMGIKKKKKKKKRKKREMKSRYLITTWKARGLCCKLNDSPRTVSKAGFHSKKMLGM